MYGKDTHVSAIDRTSYALSYQGRRDGGNMEFGINGVSLGHSVSVNASASVPSSQLCITDQFMRGLECSEDSQFWRKIGVPVRRYVDGIVSDETQDRPVQSEVCAGPRHRSRGDES